MNPDAPTVAKDRVAVIGEVIGDAFLRPSTPNGTIDLRVYPGGGPANTAVALGRLGTPTSFLGRLSTGVIGQLMYDHLAASNVDLTASVRADGPAALAVTAIDPGGQATYDFHLTDAVDWQWHADELAQLPTDTCCVHAGSLALALAPAGTLIEDLLATRRRTTTVCIDPNVRTSIVDPAVYESRMRCWSRLAEILRLSDEDLPILAPGLTFQQASHAWHRQGVRLIVLTRGSHGAIASLDGIQVQVPAPSVDTIDTVGAGDAFTAGLLHFLWHKGHLQERLERLTPTDLTAAMDFAALVAARTCAARGADPPWRQQLPAAMSR